MNRLGRPVMVLLGLALLACLAWGQDVKPDPPNPAADPTPGMNLEKKTADNLRKGKILLNFDEVEIKALAKFMSDYTGKNIVLDEKVRGKITIMSSRKVGPAEAWQIFTSALEAYGYGVIDKKKYLRIVPLKEAQQEKTKVVGPGAPLGARGFIVAIVVLTNADAEQLERTLRPMISGGGYISSFPASNALVISDTAENVSRLVEIVKRLDISYNQMKVKIFHFKNLNVKEAVTAMQGLFQGKDKEVKIAAYAPSNSLLVLAIPKMLTQIEKTLSNLDRVKAIEKKEEPRTFRVLYLENGNAEDVAKIISEMMEERKKVEVEKQKETEVPVIGEKKGFISTKVSADKETNSLILYVTDKEFEELKQMIASLDAMRKQVFISVIIAEVSLKKLCEVGTNFHVITDKGGVSFQGGLSLEGIYQLLASGNFVVGGLSNRGRTVNVAGRDIFFPDIFFFLSLLKKDSDFNVLSAPRVLTLDHKESTFSVGQVVPFATGVKFDAVGQPVITYDYKDVGLDLKVTPHISQAKSIRMEVFQGIKDVVDYLKPNIGAIGYVVPVLAKRELKTTITISDGQTIIIGGLINKKTMNVMKKVPIFSDLPIIGKIFDNKSIQEDRTTLFVFLTPHIIESTQNLQTITDKYGRELMDIKGVNEPPKSREETEVKGEIEAPQPHPAGGGSPSEGRQK